MCFDAAVRDVIDVSGEVVAARPLGDEGAELDVFPHHLLRPHYREWLTSADAVLAYAVHQTVVGHLGCVGYIREYRMLDVISDGWQYLLDESAAQLLAFAIDVGIASAAEIYALERACAQRLSLVDLFETNRAVLTRDECFTRLEFMYGTVVNVERGLNNRSL